MEYNPELISIKTGFPALDDELSNIPAYSLILVGGQTGCGKSALCKSLHAANKSYLVSEGSFLPNTLDKGSGLIYDRGTLHLDFEDIRTALLKRRYQWCVATVQTKERGVKYPFGVAIPSRCLYLANYVFTMSKWSEINMGYIRQLKSRTKPRNNNPIFYTFAEEGLVPHSGRL